MWKRCGLILATAIAFYFLALFVFGWLYSHPVQRGVGKPPADLGAETVTFPSAENVTVHGWWCSGELRRGTILLLPGIRADRLSMVNRARFLHRAGYSVLLIDLRGTGETIGPQITMGWAERQDVAAAIQFIRQQKPSENIGIIGTSLGGAAALLAMPPAKVDALVLEAVYPTIERATRNRLRPRIGPLEPMTTSLLLRQIHWRIGITSNALSPLDHIASAGCPILVIGGTVDRNTTVEDTQMLFAAARTPKELWLVKGAVHVDFYRFDRAEYERRVLAFLSNSFAKNPVNRGGSR